MLRKGLDKIFSKISDPSFGNDIDSIGDIVSLSNASTIAKVISEQLDGISPKLIELMTATMGKDVGGIVSSIAKIQDDIGIGQELLDCLVSIGISDFDPSED